MVQHVLGVVVIQIISIGERGLAVTFSKDDLISIKNGGTLHGELVNGEGKTKIMFMRDQTFKDIQRKFEKAVKVAEAEAAAKKQVEGAVAGSQALGQDIGSAEEVTQ